jgi:hypothetical protein
MEKPVQWMTLQELRDELDRTRPGSEAADLEGFLADGQLPALSKDAHRYGQVADELLRRPSNS